MPWGDRTGPEGYGPRTGRGLGYCSGFDSPGYTRGYPRGGGGRGFGRGRGPGRGYGRGFDRGYGRGYSEPYGSEPYYPPFRPVYREPAPDEEKVYLENLVKDMEKELEGVRSRIKELSKESKK
jgi:hypothetical protein